MAEVVLRLAHRTPGRIRLLAPQIAHSPEEGRRIAEAAKAVEGVSRVDARIATGSVVIFHTGDWEPIAAALGEALGGEVACDVEGPARQPHAMDSASGLIDRLDETAARAFGRRTDISELAFLGLLAAGAVQLARGQVFGPAATLFSQAFSLMAVRGSRGR